MNTKAAIVAASMLFSLGANAGPFGIDPGDPIHAEGVDAGGFIYETVNVENTGGFDAITKYGTSGVGTCWIVATTFIFDSNAGLKIQEFFYGVNDILTEKYGEPSSKEDFLEPDSFWSSTEHWMHSLEIGHRVLSYIWVFRNAEEISRILLDVSVQGRGATVRLQYDFDNVQQCKEARKQVF